MDTCEQEALSQLRLVRIIIFFCRQNSLFRQLCCFFAKWGLLFASLYVCKSRAVFLNPSDPIALLHHSPFSSAKFKIAVTFCAAGMQCMADTCSSVQWRYKFSHRALFKLLTGGAATAGAGGRHVSHELDSQRLTYSWPKSKHKFKTMQ